MPDQSLSVTFSNICEVPSLIACDISIEHDDLLNGGASSFELGDTIFYRAFPAGKYTITPSNGGTGVVRSPNVVAEISEKITFSGETTANLSHPLCGSFSYSWIGNAIRASDRTKIIPKISATKNSNVLNLTEAVYGTVDVTYEYCYSSLSFSPVNAGQQTILFCRSCESTQEFVCDSILEDIEDQAFDDVTLIINDACDSNIKVTGAQVEINGELIELTSGGDGKIHVGLLAKGTYSIKVTAPGYTPSNEDSLSNDEIIVE